MKIEIFVCTTKLVHDLSYMTYEEKQNLEALEITKVKLIKLFSGLTITPNQKGFWLNEKQEIETDNVETWLIYTSTKEYSKLRLDLDNILAEIKRITAQQTQAYTIDNEIKFI